MPARAAGASGAPLGDGPDPYAAAVLQTVRAIAEYSRWPQEGEVLNLCIVGPADHASELSAFNLSRNRVMRARKVAVEEIGKAGCEAVYLGRLSVADQRRIIAALPDRPVLTIAENDPACRGHAMFCLIFETEALTFRLNLDAVSRSGIRVDPRVLRLATAVGELQ